MPTYGDMQSRIADEIKRNNLTTQIQNAIQTAIRAYESRPFWFNQQRATASTAASVRIYGLPTEAPEGPFKKMRLIRLQWTSNNWDPLEELTRDEMFEQYPGDSYTGVPCHYYIEWLAKTTPSNDRATIGQLWLLPTPNAVYSMELHFFRDLGTLSALTDENAWTDEAELLIRCRAKRELFTHVINNTEGALKMAAAEQDALRDLSRKNSMAQAPGRLAANW